MALKQKYSKRNVPEITDKYNRLKLCIKKTAMQEHSLVHDCIFFSA